MSVRCDVSKFSYNSVFDIWFALSEAQLLYDNDRHKKSFIAFLASSELEFTYNAVFKESEFCSVIWGENFYSL